MRTHFSKSYLRRPTRVKFPYKKISCSCVIAERRAGRMLIGVFQGTAVIWSGCSSVIIWYPQQTTVPDMI